jgi:hypothetical protein
MHRMSELKIAGRRDTGTVNVQEGGRKGGGLGRIWGSSNINARLTESPQISDGLRLSFFTSLRDMFSLPL